MLDVISLHKLLLLLAKTYRAEEFIKIWYEFETFAASPDGTITKVATGDEFNASTLEAALISVHEDFKNAQRDLQKHRRLMSKADKKKAPINPVEVATIPDIAALKPLLTIFIKQRVDEALAKLAASLRHDPNMTSEASHCEQWIRAVTGRLDPTDLAVFRHWCWQVKRKLFGKSIQWETMLNVYGTQGTGKTFSIRHLCKPLKAVTSEMSLPQLLDEKNQPLLAYNYINLFEELEGSDRADVERLKRIMSGDKISYRILYKQTQANIRQNCTFIGSSNKRISDSFYDTTGMRRFFEITCDKPVPREQLAAVDATKLWREIDESLEHGYLTEGIRASVQVVQEAMRWKTALQDWLIHTGLLVKTREAAENSPALLARGLSKDLYTNYNEYCFQTGQKPGAIGRFTKDMAQLFDVEEHDRRTYFLVDKATVDELKIKVELRFMKRVS